MDTTLQAIWAAVGAVLIVVIPWVGKLVVAWLQKKIEEINARTIVHAVEQTLQGETNATKKEAAVELADGKVSNMALEAAVNKMKGGDNCGSSNPTEAD